MAWVFTLGSAFVNMYEFELGKGLPCGELKSDRKIGRTKRI